MAATPLINGESVILPNNLKALNDFFPVVDIAQESLSPKQQIVKRYSVQALEIGRPLDSAVILMAGETGSGKSTTINTLFDEAELCKTSNVKSETKNISVIQKWLLVTADTVAVKGKLCFIDIPGTLDTENDDGNNLVRIKKFKNECVELANRKILENSISTKEQVCPNIILFVVSACDERMGGSNSSLVKSLKTFKVTSDLIDYDRNNVIVVLTHAMSLGFNKECFMEELQIKTEIIRKQVNEHLGIKDVVVVPVENKPNKFNLEKVEDFYKLPDGQFSHLNLFDAMQNCMSKNNDILGSELIAHYFNNCPEKLEKATVKEFDCEVNKNDLEIATEALDLIIGLNLPKPLETSAPIYNFQSLGRGFCPVTEQVKPAFPFAYLGSLRQVAIENSIFSVPEKVKDYVNLQSKYRRLTFLEKTEYQNHKKGEYGMDANTELVFQGKSQGRWIDKSSSNSESSQLLLRHEIQVAKFTIDNPREIPLHYLFQRDLDSLPEEYSTEPYGAFISKWGTHFIYEEAVGGALQMNCTISKSELKNEELKSIDASMSTIFNSLCKVNANVDYSGQLEELRKLGVSNEVLQIEGGRPPTILTLENLKPEDIETWTKSVANAPAELPSSIKIFPYYNLLSFGKKYSNLRLATEKYLRGECNVSIRSASRSQNSEMVMMSNVGFGSRIVDATVQAAATVIVGLLFVKLEKKFPILNTQTKAPEKSPEAELQGNELGNLNVQ